MAAQSDRFCTQFFCQFQGAKDYIALLSRKTLELCRLDIDHNPFRLQQLCQTVCGTHQVLRIGARPDADQHPFLYLPDVLNGVVIAVITHLRLNTIGRAT